MKSMLFGFMIGLGLWTIAAGVSQPVAEAAPGDRSGAAVYPPPVGSPAGSPRSGVASFITRSVMSTTDAAGGELIAMSAVTADDRQQVTLVDPRTRTMCVYHIDGKSGEVTLKSVRNVSWDMQMLEFNATSPTPRELRSQVQR
jgi:hypothetical protein